MKDECMNGLQVCQGKWAQASSQPWKDAKLVGNAADAREELLKLLRQSVNLQNDGRGGECISSLLIGPPGVGKTFVVKSAIDALRAEGNLVIPITLHGSICSDDKSSMRQIFSQFQSHLIGGSSLDGLSRTSFRQGTLSEWCDRLSQVLQECNRSDHMVVITLEDFDSFCHSKAKQSLLYNLFDLMHVKDTRFVVIGVTTRPDASEMLEKRIKSRFQLRKIVVAPPDSLDEMIEIVQAVLCSDDSPSVKEAKIRGRKSQTPKRVTSVSSIVEQVLESKELRQNWSIYRDMGYSSRDFTTAALSALLEIHSEGQIQPALVTALHARASRSLGDVGVVKSILRTLTIRDHIILVGLMKLHQYGKRPKCFAHVLKEVGSFEKRSSCSLVCRHSKRAYWDAFKGLVRLGLIELGEYSGISAAVAPPPMFARCRLTIAGSYATLFYDKSSETLLSLLPNEVHQWATQTKEVHDGI